MKCPNCHVNFIEIESQGVIIDCCPKCRGKWLIYGKLDRIVAKILAGYAPDKVALIKVEDPFQGEHYNSEGHHGHDGHYSGHKRREKKIGPFGKIFDF